MEITKAKVLQGTLSALKSSFLLKKKEYQKALDLLKRGLDRQDIKEGCIPNYGQTLCIIEKQLRTYESLIREFLCDQLFIVSSTTNGKTVFFIFVSGQGLSLTISYKKKSYRVMLLSPQAPLKIKLLEALVNKQDTVTFRKVTYHFTPLT